MRLVRLVAVTWWLQLKLRSRSAFDGLLSLLWPLGFASTVFLMYRQRDPGAVERRREQKYRQESESE